MMLPYVQSDRFPVSTLDAHYHQHHVVSRGVHELVVARWCCSRCELSAMSSCLASSLRRDLDLKSDILSELHPPWRRDKDKLPDGFPYDLSLAWNSQDGAPSRRVSSPGQTSSPCSIIMATKIAADDNPSTCCVDEVSIRTCVHPQTSTVKMRGFSCDLHRFLR